MYCHDEDFTWEEHNEAQLYIARLYQRCCGKYPIIKDKFGSLRYEFLSLWILTESDKNLFYKILVRALRKYPSAALELLLEWKWLINEHKVLRGKV